ncbi:ABC transporter substrate-binding protein [Vibrio profundum]|uniref:ABC transporter substrate-binding protein n=1 Tax=Vibrio profundum TaxID=2910247 RepID=UPI003D1298BC
MILRIISLMAITLIPTTFSYAKEFKVAMIYPRDAPFWRTVIKLSQESANDLGIELTAYNAKDSHVKMKKILQTVVAGPDKVDAVVFSNFKHMAPKLIEIADAAGVYSFLFNSAMNSKDAKSAGSPRVKYKNWIGEMLPDETSAGIKLTNLLIDAALANGKVNADGQVEAIGINGPRASGSAIVREKLLEHAVGMRNDVELLQIVHSEKWDEKDSKQKFIGLANRYPAVSVYWAGNDRLVNGIIQGANELKLKPGTDIFTGGSGLNETTLKQIQAGHVVASYGGHYIEGAWVMVLLYDYLNGIDFAQESLEMKTPVGVATKENVDLYLGKLTEEKLSESNLRKIDFTQYSKKYNPSVSKYNFDFDSVLDQL